MEGEKVATFFSLITTPLHKDSRFINNNKAIF